MQRISVIDPIARAWERMVLVCFRPFDLAKWLALGFCAWLAYLGQGGGNIPNFPGGGGGGGTVRGPGGSSSTTTPFEEAMSWIDAHLAWVVLGVVVVVVLGLGLFLLLEWLRARGKFMFVDGIATNRGEGLIVEPWKRLAPQANSFFRYNAAITLAGGVLMWGAVGIGVWIAWPDLVAWQFGDRAIAAIVWTVLTGVVFWLILMTILACNGLFVLPIMYIRGGKFPAAWREFWKQIVPGHIWSLTLFFAMLFVLTIGAGIVTMLATVLTCCLAALPYVGTVIALPILVFIRSYSLYYLEQFGPQYTIMSAEPPEHGFEVIMPPPPPPPPGSESPPLPSPPQV